MHKTPDEIKTGVEFCTTKVISGNLKTCDLDCPYRVEGVWCRNALSHDTLSYIQQLEQERIMLMDTVSKMCGKTQRWISVEERLPEEGKFVLLQYAKNAQNPTLHARNTMAVGRYEYGMFLVEGCSVRVTHWMPLPEPPVEV